MRAAAIALIFAACACAEMKTIPVTAGAAADALEPAAAAWKNAAPVSLALHRTPPLYPTDTPAKLDITDVQVRVLRGAGQTFVRLEWQDDTRNATKLPKAERAWQGEHLVKQSGATDRFSDACAVMVPAQPVKDVFPSLQMGDAAHPVRLYLYDATRGPAVLEAAGRETTKRTGATFPARAQYAAGKWAVTLQLPELAPGTPVAVAIWNGAQQDRDGRKYFTVWYKTQ